MMRPVDDRITWLRAQLDDDERKARAVEPLGYTTDLGGNRLDEHFAHGRVRYASEDGMPRHDKSDPAAAAHFAAHGPARVLREVEAKRKIIDQYEDHCRAVDLGGAGICTRYLVDELEKVLRALVLPYADRPGYREEWRP
jgi:hypothetical protein